MGLPQRERGRRTGAARPLTLRGRAARATCSSSTAPGDDNVHYQGTERLIDALVSLGKPFDVMVYPNRTHCICEGRGTSRHLFQTLTRYLTTHLPPGPASAGAASR